MYLLVRSTVRWIFAGVCIIGLYFVAKAALLGLALIMVALGT